MNEFELEREIAGQMRVKRETQIWFWWRRWEETTTKHPTKTNQCHSTQQLFLPFCSEPVRFSEIVWHFVFIFWLLSSSRDNNANKHPFIETLLLRIGLGLGNLETERTTCANTPPRNDSGHYSAEKERKHTKKQRWLSVKWSDDDSDQTEQWWIGACYY